MSPSDDSDSVDGQEAYPESDSKNTVRDSQQPPPNMSQDASTDSESSDTRQNTEQQQGQQDVETTNKNENQREWTTVRVSRNTHELLEDIIENTTATSKKQLLTSAIQALNHAVHEPRGADWDDVVSNPEKSWITGLQVQTDSHVEHVGINPPDQAVLIEKESEPESVLQPLARAQYRRARIHCPACGNAITNYTLNPKYPVVGEGAFTSFDAWCHICESYRPIYTLFAAQDSEQVTDRLLAQAMKRYIAHVLIGESLTKQEFKSRVDNIHQLVRDGDWEWLPEPSLWIGFETSTGPKITESLYVQFLSQYFTYQLKSVLELEMVDVRIGRPTQTESGHWELIIDYNAVTVDDVYDYIQSFVSHWDTETVTVETRDSDAFAESRIAVEFLSFS